MVGARGRWTTCVVTVVALLCGVTGCSPGKADPHPQPSDGPSVVISPSSQPAGKVVELGGGARVVFKDDLGPDTVLNVATKDAPPPPTGQKAFATPVELSLTGGNLGRGATLEFPLNGMTVAEARQVHIRTFDTEAGEWVPVTTTVNAEAKMIVAFTPHFSWYAPWTWDWAAIGAQINQDVGELVGERAGEPDCKRHTGRPSWVRDVVGSTKDAAVAVRSCTESEGDVLAVEMVNNRPYGQILTFGSGVKWAWREEGDSLAEQSRNSIVSGLLGKNQLYLPPKGRASVGINKLDPGKSADFYAGIGNASLFGDLFDIVAPKLVQKTGNRIVGPLLSACSSGLFTAPPSVPSDLGEIREQMFNGLDCFEKAFYEAVDQGLLNKAEVGQLVDTMEALKSATLVGRVLTFYDVEWKLLDVYVDTRVIPGVRGIGYGFTVYAKSDTSTGSDSPGSEPTGSEPTGEPEPVASDLSVALSANPFTCDGGTRALGTLSGAQPGERIEFSSDQVGGLSPGSANGDGQLALTWECSPGDAGTEWTVRATGSSGGSTTFTVTGKSVDPPPAANHEFHVQDDVYGGTWARHDPDDGTWFGRGSRPGNAAYWFDNSLGIAVDCARSAASYPVRISGRRETWSWWLHVTDNTWIPAATIKESSADGDQGVAHC